MTRFTVLSVLLILVFVSGCGEEDVAPPPPPAAPAPKPKPAAPKPAAAAQIPAAATETTVVEYTYDVSIRDPFQPAVGLAKDRIVNPTCGPLCEYDLSQFRIRGIIWGIAEPVATMQAPNGKAYIAKVGVPIGKNNGKIVSITADGLVVLEKYVNYKGEVVTNRVDVRLPVVQSGRR